MDFRDFITRLRRAGFLKLVRWVSGIPTRFLIGKIWRCVKLRYGSTPVSPQVLSIWHCGSRILTLNSSPLMPPVKEIDLNSENIVDPKIRIALRDQIFTRSSVDVESLNYIVSYIKQNNVKHVLEFGSGLSTVALTIACRDSIGDQDIALAPYVVSIDQSLEYAAKTRQLLVDLRLDHLAEVIHCPPIDRKLGWHVFKKYKWNIGNIPYLRSGWCADMIFVDGPAFGGLSRALATIDGLQCGTKNCRVFMDDGLRNDEIRSMRYLQKHKYITFSGVIPIGKGIALGMRC